jgi:HrpA-like RNA helicase
MEAKQNTVKLPINLQKELIIKKVKENQVTLIQGETGSGKTTQVPQIIYNSRILPKKMVIGIT